MFLFLASAAAAASVPARRAEFAARATIRIERPAIASSKAWDQAPKAAKAEIIRRDERGQPTLLRLIEHQ
jgi:hypothetical protein